MLRACVTTPTAAVAASFRRRISQRSGRGVYHHRRRTVMSGTTTSDEKVYPEEQKVEVGGKLYRRCAAALVFNLNGEVLVGERTDRPGSWNMPQGGVEMSETTIDAASRELYEEVGMKVGTTRGLVVVGDLPQNDAFAYAAGGWLAKKGLAGQRLEFCLFHLPTADDPTPYCDLGGLGGEKAEFSQVKWMSFDDVIESVWESKRGPYVKCKELAAPLIKAHLDTK